VRFSVILRGGGAGREYRDLNERRRRVEHADPDRNDQPNVRVMSIAVVLCRRRYGRQRLQLQRERVELTGTTFDTMGV